MYSWIFLASLNKAVNLSHYISGNVSEVDGRTQVLLVSSDPKQDNVTVTDPADVALLRDAFNSHALQPLMVAGSVELTETDNSPLPAEAATDEVSTAASDAPSQKESPQSAQGTAETQANPLRPSVASAVEQPANGSAASVVNFPQSKSDGSSPFVS